MSEQRSTNIRWHDGEVTRADRAELLGHAGATLWFTGLSGSGKSTIAVALEQELHKRGVLVYRLDGDNVRHGINKNLGFSAEDRTENVRRVGEVSKLFVDAGFLVLSSFISPYLADRHWFVKCTIPMICLISKYLWIVVSMLQKVGIPKGCTRKREPVK